MYTLYKVGSGYSNILIISSQMHDFPGINKRFNGEVAPSAQHREKFCILENGRPYELWEIRTQADVLGGEFVTEYNSLPDDSKVVWTAMLGGKENLEKRLANLIPGYRGSRLFIWDEPQTDHRGRWTWPKIHFSDIWTKAVYDPEEYFRAKLPGHGQIHQKEVNVEGFAYFIQVLQGQFHVFTTDWRWLGKFKLVVKDGRHQFQILTINYGFNDPGPRRETRECEIKPVFANSQKGAIRELVYLVFNPPPLR